MNSSTNKIKSVSIDADHLKVELRDGRVLQSPLALYPTLSKATARQRSKWEPCGAGTGIHWPLLNYDLSVAGLLRGEAEAPGIHRAKKAGKYPEHKAGKTHVLAEGSFTPALSHPMGEGTLRAGEGRPSAVVDTRVIYCGDCLEQLRHATPAALGYSMPAEWERHQATWLGWPHNPTDWPGKLDAIRWVYGEMVRKISQGEFVRILVRHEAERRLAGSYLRRAGCDLKKVQFVVHPTNRGWTRDSGPVFVRRKISGGDALPRVQADRQVGPTTETAIVHFHFNAWAKYLDWRKDRKVPETAARLLKKPLFNAEHNGNDFVIEGGGIDVNGRGSLLTTEECYLHPKVQIRNPGMTRGHYDETLKKYLGVTNVLWLRNGPVGDDTHGHIDDICRFVNRKTVVLIRETNRRDVNYRPLAENWDRIRDLRLEDGSRPEVVALPMPAPLYFAGDRLPASYANFYICNAAVLVPTFNDPQDRVALGILGELFMDRPVVGIHAVDLVLGFGTLHCLTQQQPA